MSAMRHKSERVNPLFLRGDLRLKGAGGGGVSFNIAKTTFAPTYFSAAGGGDPGSAERSFVAGPMPRAVRGIPGHGAIGMKSRLLRRGTCETFQIHAPLGC